MSYKIHIANTDTHFVCEQNQNILEAAHQADVLLSYGCKNGFCGSCEAQIKTGTIDYPEGNPKGITEEEIEKGKVLLCKAVANSDLSIEARVEKPETKIEVKTLPVKVKRLQLLADDVMQVFLELPSTEETFEFLAGQWFYVLMKDGKKRAFSIANTQNSEKLLEVHIRHANGGVFTDFVFNELKVGDILKIEGPQGTFFYHEDYRDIVMVAGGTGFAPLKGIIEDLINRKNQPNIHLYWGVRSKKDLYMEALIEQWVEKGIVKYTPVLSDPATDDAWTGKTGFVHQIIDEDNESYTDYEIYMAGPPQMIEACKQVLKAKNAKNIYYDSFEYSDDATKSLEDE